MATATMPLFSSLFLTAGKKKKKLPKGLDLSQVLSALSASNPGLFQQLTVDGQLNPAIPQDILKRLAKGKGLKTKQLLKLQLLNVGIPSAEFEFAKSKELYGITKEQLQKILAEGGFSPEALAAMRGNAIEGTATQFAGAREAIATELARRGLRTGMAPISGEALRRTAELGGAQAIATSGALRDVTLQNERQRLQNVFNAINIASGFPANPQASMGASANLGSTIAQLKMTEPGNVLASLGASLGGALIGMGTDVAGSYLRKKEG